MTECLQVERTTTLFKINGESVDKKKIMNSRNNYYIDDDTEFNIKIDNKNFLIKEIKKYTNANELIFNDDIQTTSLFGGV